MMQVIAVIGSKRGVLKFVAQVYLTYRETPAIYHQLCGVD